MKPKLNLVLPRPRISINLLRPRVNISLLKPRLFSKIIKPLVDILTVGVKILPNFLYGIKKYGTTKYGATYQSAGSGSGKPRVLGTKGS